MAEFCKQCAEEIGFTSDFINIKGAKKGLYHTVLCEGCGPCQVNSQGECISSDCMAEGHNVPLDTNVSYWIDIDMKNFDTKGVKLKEIEYGEWSHTIRDEHIGFESIDDIPHTIGNRIYVCWEGTYNLYEII